MNGLSMTLMIIAIFLGLAGAGGVNPGMCSLAIIMVLVSALLFISGNRQQKERYEATWRKAMLDKEKHL